MGGAGLTVDLGTGDGSFVLRRARAEPGLLHVGIDANAAGLQEASRKAARKPARGGAPNALFVRASAEALPDALAGLATAVTLLLPWGSLLRQVATADPRLAAGLRALCAPSASLTIVLGYAAGADPVTAALPPLDRARLEGELLPAFRAAGFDGQVAPVTPDELRALGTTWAARLAFGRPRHFWRLSAVASLP